jgi:hypothetical protein
MKPVLIFLLCLCQLATSAQFAPQAGLAGSTAISAGSSTITAWATHCDIQRGYLDIANTSLGLVSGGVEAYATGPADGGLVSLGDSGIAVLTFDAALYNGPGPDFAVFENGFRNPVDSAMAFLELAFVEVSSDGLNYFRFPATSHIPTNTQIPASGVYTDASQINNLAGKYIAMYGTPFDLEELAGESGLDINNVTHVRLVDVVGAVTAHACHDKDDNVINDPYPTNFPYGGFDLDAVAAIHTYGTAISSPTNAIAATIYPNPASNNITIRAITTTGGELHASITSITGTRVKDLLLGSNDTTIALTQFPAGLYYIIISDTNGSQWAGKIIKY